MNIIYKCMSYISIDRYLFGHMNMYEFLVFRGIFLFLFSTCLYMFSYIRKSNIVKAFFRHNLSKKKKKKFELSKLFIYHNEY